MQLRTSILTFLAALIGSLFGLFALLPLGLVVHSFVVFPLAFGVAALFAALSAGWAGTAMATDGTRAHLASVVIRAEIAAAILALLQIILYLSNVTLPGPLIGVIVVCSILLATITSAATHRSRRKQGESGNDVRFTVMLLLAAVVLVPVVILVASLFGLTGA